MRPKLSRFELTADILRHLLHYDPLTGEWTWVNPLPHSSVRPGDKAGRIMDNGRRQLRIASGFYYSSRLAWLYMTGEWPKDQIDHVNRLNGDDRWANLREATQSENSYNRSWCESNGDMRGIRKHGRQYRVDIGNAYLGLYDNLESAKKVRDQALADWAGPFAILPERKSNGNPR